MIHHKKLLASALLLGIGAVSEGAYATALTPPFNECPAVGASPSCSILFEFTDTGTNTYVDSSVGPYDSSDDALVGVINNSSATVNSLSLTGSSIYGGIFAFEGDGIQTFITVDTSSLPANYNLTGYEGPTTYFSNISMTSVFADTGVVNFVGGLAAGATAYFSLEGSPDAIQSGGGITTGPSVPEPGTLGLMGLGLSLVSLAARFRKSKA